MGTVESNNEECPENNANSIVKREQQFQDFQWIKRMFGQAWKKMNLQICLDYFCYYMTNHIWEQFTKKTSCMLTNKIVADFPQLLHKKKNNICKTVQWNWAFNKFDKWNGIFKEKNVYCIKPNIHFCIVKEGNLWICIKRNHFVAISSSN